MLIVNEKEATSNKDYYYYIIILVDTVKLARNALPSQLVAASWSIRISRNICLSKKQALTYTL